MMVHSGLQMCVQQQLIKKKSANLKESKKNYKGEIVERKR